MNKFSNFTNTKSAFMSQYNIFRYKEIINLFKTNNNFVIREMEQVTMIYH